jgi:hypothetical protein
MNATGRIFLVVLAAGSTFACKTIDQRYYYRQGIIAFDKHLPPSGKSCWLTPDLTGPQAGSNQIAEEEFTKYLIDRNLCRVIEKHPDDVAGYSWPKEDVCPCGSGVVPCAFQCEAKKEGGGGGGGFGLPSIGGSAPAGHDNNQSSDKLLERYKKSQLVDKVIVYRIDELNKDRCVIHFRVSDAKANNASIEASQTFIIPAKVEEAASQ